MKILRKMSWGKLLYSLPQGINLHQTLENKFLHMHLRTAPRTTKYSLMKPPIKNLIGGVEELHTREYLLKISAQTMGCRERSKFGAKNSKKTGSSIRTRVLGKKERERKKTYLGDWPVGPRRPVGAAKGVAVPPGRLDQGWPPLVSPRCLWVPFYVEKLIFIFL